jgi:arylsulfatase A-like enzyme
VSGRPNILILMTDQQRADCLSCAGHPQLRTPNMDRLCAEGVRFSRALTSSPLCMPARASFICGRHVHNHGMWGNRGELAAGDESFFRCLQEAGYTTAHIGKSHYWQHGSGHTDERIPYMQARGFDYVDEIGGPLATQHQRSRMTDEWEAKGLYQAYKDDYKRRIEFGRHRAVWPSPLPVEDFADSYVGRRAVEHVEGLHAGRPFCLFVGFGGPHEPWDAPGLYAAMYDPAGVPPPVDFRPAEPGPWVPAEAAALQRRGRFEDLTLQDAHRLRANYYGKISLLDDWFGRIFAALERRGLWDDLLVVFWSDHGDLTGEHRRVYKSCFYEGALRVPLAVRRPGRAEAGRVSEAPATTVDIMPTVLEAAGLPMPSGCDGLSLWPQLRDPAVPLRGCALSEVAAGESHLVMACTERWKFATHDEIGPYMLYDLQEDPDERNNLIGHPDYAAVQAEMLARLNALRTAH